MSAAPEVAAAPRGQSPFLALESDRLPTLCALVAELAGACAVIPEAEGDALLVSEVALELPIELGMMDEGEGWRLDAAPPTQQVETTVLPVWHRLRLKVSLDDGERSLDAVEA
jgi:hypothetical protein